MKFDIDLAKKFREYKYKNYSLREIGLMYNISHTEVSRQLINLDKIDPMPKNLSHIIDTYGYIFLLEKDRSKLKNKIGELVFRGVVLDNIYVDIADKDICDEDLVSTELDHKGRLEISLDVSNRKNLMKLRQKLGRGDKLFIIDWNELTNYSIFFENIFRDFIKLGVNVEVVSGYKDMLGIRMKMVLSKSK